MSFMRSNNRKMAGRECRGFTSIELIIVIIVMAVLAGTLIIKNPFSISDYASIAANQLIADIQYVQMRAMGLGSQRQISFSTNSGQYCLCRTTGCTVANCSATGEIKRLPGDVVVTSTTFANALVFNSLGEPTFGTGNGTINLSNTRNVTIYGITGKVD